MNCKEIIKNLGFECTQRGELTIISTPFYSPIDGDGIQLFIESTGDQHLITDYGKTAQHAESHNLILNDSRRNAVYLRSGCSDSLRDDWSICTIAAKHNIQEKLSEALSAVVALSQAEVDWLPELSTDQKFKAQVAKFLTGKFGNKLLSGYGVKGFSGHQYEIPFAVESENKLLIHYVSQIDGNQLRWPSVTNIAGIMGDIDRNEDCKHLERLVVIDDQNLIDRQQLDEANLLLNQTVTTLPYSKREQWVNNLAA